MIGKPKKKEAYCLSGDAIHDRKMPQMRQTTRVPCIGAEFVPSPSFISETSRLKSTACLSLVPPPVTLNWTQQPATNQTCHHPSLASHPFVDLHLQHVCGRDLLEGISSPERQHYSLRTGTDARDTHTRHVTGHQHHVEQFLFF